jgi:hypothetical protein
MITNTNNELFVIREIRELRIIDPGHAEWFCKTFWSSWLDGYRRLKTRSVVILSNIGRLAIERGRQTTSNLVRVRVVQPKDGKLKQARRQSGPLTRSTGHNSWSPYKRSMRGIDINKKRQGLFLVFSFKYYSYKQRQATLHLGMFRMH